MNISVLLKFPKIRAKCIHYIKNNHFDELDISIPLKNDYCAKLFHNDSYDSFSDIFIQDEYKGFIPSRSVVIPGSYSKSFPSGNYNVSCALIIGKRKESTDKKTSLNEALRTHDVAV